MDWDSGRQTLLALVPLYGRFALAQVLWKVLRQIYTIHRSRRMLKDVPFGHGVATNMLGAWRKNYKRAQDWRAEITRGFRSCKAIPTLLNPPMLLVKDPALIRHILKDGFDKYTKPTSQTSVFFHIFREFLGEGIFTQMHGSFAPDKGHSWSMQRKMAANIFSKSNFTGLMHEVFLEKSRRLSDLLSQDAEHGWPVDLQDLFFKLTMDGVMQIFFGEASDTLTGGTTEYASAFDLAHNSFMKFTSETMAAHLASELFLPWPFGGRSGLAWRLIRVFSKSYRDFQAAYRKLDSESRRSIQACRGDPLLLQRRDLLALFLQAEEKEQLSSAFLRDVVLSFILAGRDTTACTLSWMFFLIATNPDVQAKLCEEIDKKLPGGAAPTWTTVGASSMPYLHGVLYETFRLYPAVPVNQKECQADDVFPDGTPVPKHTKVNYMTYARGRDATVYTEPLEVRPERWIPFEAPDPYAFPVFQAGPRICLGMDMAIYEIKVVASVLLQRYTFELVPGEREKIMPGRKLTMDLCNDKDIKGESHNLWVIPKPRSALP